VIPDEEEGDGVLLPLEENAGGYVDPEFPQGSGPFLDSETDREIAGVKGSDKGVDISLDFHPLGGMAAPEDSFEASAE